MTIATTLFGAIRRNVLGCFRRLPAVAEKRVTVPMPFDRLHVGAPALQQVRERALTLAERQSAERIARVASLEALDGQFATYFTLCSSPRIKGALCWLQTMSAQDRAPVIAELRDCLKKGMGEDKPRNLANAILAVLRSRPNVTAPALGLGEADQLAENLLFQAISDQATVQAGGAATYQSLHNAYCAVNNEIHALGDQKTRAAFRKAFPGLSHMELAYGAGGFAERLKPFIERYPHLKAYLP